MPFSNSKRSILTISKKMLASFLPFLFLNIKKSVLTKLKKNEAQFFANQLFKILRKVYLQILKKTWPNFLWINFLKY